MGAEMHAGTPQELEELLNFRPGGDTPLVVHLPRDFDLLQEQSRKGVLDFAARFAGQVYGLVLHDTTALAARVGDYVDAAWLVDNQLEKINRCPILFVEYAVGLEPAEFVRFFSAIPDLDRVSVCLDTGHVGIRAARTAYARKHGGEDVCALKWQPARLPQVIAEVDAAVAAGAAAVCELLEPICALNKPVHFHLHDAHPLSTFSPFGVSDHLSFLTEIPLAFEHHGRRACAPMFGPQGLTRLVARALQLQESRRLSFTLEIHPTGEGLPLEAAAPLFEHWTETTNAERMNHWLSVLSRNHALLCGAIQAASSPDRLPEVTGAAPGPCGI